MIVYVITNKINGKRYVGQTIQSMEARWSKHCSIYKANKGMPIVNAIQKYGKDVFEKEILMKCESVEEMNHWEKFYIKSFESLTPNGYNVLPGGKNSLHTEETKRKIKEAQTGELNHNFGKKASLKTKQKMSLSRIGMKHSEEFRRACSERVIGKKHPMFGKHHTEETKNKISKSNKGKIFSIETRNKLSKAKDRDKVKIYCFQTDIIYDSITLVSRILDLDRSKIKEVAKGKRSHTYGYTFKFVEEGKF
jgi:hypothetical protein